MNGQLSDHPLAELIHEISEARLSGALRLERERVRAVVYFDGGQVVAALTNLRAYRLAEILRRGGAVEEARLAEVVKEGMSDEQAGIALVRAGALAAAELKRHQDRQSEEVLRLLLRWPDGTWEFDPRVRLAGEFRAQIGTPRLLVEAARQFPPEVFQRVMEAGGESVSPSPDAQARLDGGALQLLPAEAFVLTRVYAPVRLDELIAVSGLAQAEALRAVYVLALGGLLRREGRRPAISPEALKQAQSQPSRPSSAKETVTNATTTKEEATPTPAPTPQPPPPAPEPEAEQDPREGMEELFERSRAATHYEVLGVTRSAKQGELKRAYYALAKRLHPDRFRRFADEAMRLQVDLAFARIAQAYEVLNDAKQRASYDLKLSSEQARAAATPAPENPSGVKDERGGASGDSRAAEEPPSPALSQESAVLYRAEEKYQQGMAALQQSNHQLALKYFGEAALLVPKQARYRAYYGRVLAREKQTRRQAEAELLAAVSLDDKNPAYRVMLAELYRDIGLRRRAEGELERALALDPQHANARRLLGELRTK